MVFEGQLCGRKLTRAGMEAAWQRRDTCRKGVQKVLKPASFQNHSVLYYFPLNSKSTFLFGLHRFGVQRVLSFLQGLDTVFSRGM